ncbi:MAG: putative prophage repressor [Candidatus Acidoferrum typicum]|nr:putative prophage repressor [Candidatus Acidoferrum typicum]
MNTSLSKVRTRAYADCDIGDHLDEIGSQNGKAMPKSQSKSGIPPKPEWATAISELRQRLNLSQTAFGRRLHSSAMGISRWERGTHEPPAGIYIELGNLAGAPLCWYFWGRAGLRNEDLMRVMPKLRESINRANVINFQIASAGGGHKRPKVAQLVAVPLVKVVAASHGENGDSVPTLHDAPVETMIAAPKAWCPNPSTTTCLRVKGNSMNPLLYDGYILVVDSSQTDPSNLDGKIVIAWHKDKGLTVSRLQAYDHTEVLRAENSAYDSIVLNKKHSWKIVAKVLWWIGRAP